MLPTEETASQIPTVLHRSKLLSVAIVDAEGVLKSVNKKFRETFAKPLQRIGSASFAKAHHPDDGPALNRALEHCIENGDVTETITLRTLRPSGGYEETEWEFSALPGKADAPAGVLCISHGMARPENQPETSESNEETLLQISRGVTDVYFTTDLNFELTYISPSVEKVTGFTVQEAMEKPIANRYPPATLQRMSEVLAQEIEAERDPAADKNRTRTLEGHQYHADGSLIAVNFHVSFIRNEQGVPVGLQGITRDVTEARRNEEELRVIKERYEQIAVRSRTVVWEVDIDGKYIYMNSAAEELYGYTISEIVGKLYFYDLCPPEHREVFKEQMLALMRSGAKLGAQEAVYLAQDGTDIYVLTWGEPVIDDLGNITGYRGSAVDITEKKKAEMQLRNSHDRLTRLARASRTVVWDINSKGVFTYVSPESEIVYGRKPDELVGRYFYDIHPAEGREAFKTLVSEIGNSGETIADLENMVEKPSGELVWVSTGGVPRYDGDGNIIGYSGSDTDITARKRAENTLRELLLDKDKMAKMQAMLFDIALKYINIPLSQVPDAVQQSLREIGEYAGTHRAVVFSYDFANDTATCLYEWTASGIVPMIGEFQKVPLRHFPNMKEAHRSGQSVYVANTGNLNEASPERDILVPRDVRTSLSVPIMGEGRCTGFVGIESVGELHDYGDREEILLDVFSGLIHNVQEREKSEKELVRMQILLEETG
ncbi:MAG: PAS domain S-box protein [Cryomorphaceae bacterium]